MQSQILITLSERGFIHQATNLEGLDSLACNKPIVAYIGFDLTADSLHIGSLIQIMVLRWLKKLGHQPIVLFGEATTRIGDPSGKSSQRPMLTSEQIEHNREGIVRTIDRLVGHCQHETNATWFSEDSPSYINFLEKFGRHFTINRMLTFDSVKTRLNRNEPLTFLEFNYMLMQAVDFLKLNDKNDCVLQIGGSDQWGNIINGVELIRRINEQEAFGLTTPLLTNSAGEKMGKSAGNAIWLDPDKTSAFEFWQFWRNVEDRKVGEFLRLFTEISMDDIFSLEILDGKEINKAKIVLATEVTALVHGRATAEDVARIAQNQNTISESTPTFFLSSKSFNDGITLAQIMLDAGLVKSKTEATKLAMGGGVKMNGSSILDARLTMSRDSFDGDHFILTIGKNRMVLIKIQD